MENNDLVPVYNFCVSHHIEMSFIDNLQQHGLVEITTLQEQQYLNESQVSEAEKFVRLHYDLDINLEGIAAIAHLLDRIREMQQYNLQLQNRLMLYETSHNRTSNSSS